MSISPQRGQRTPFLPESGINQKAGQAPAPSGSFARISKYPYCQDCLSQVVSLAEVYSGFMGGPIREEDLPYTMEIDYVRVYQK